MMKNIPLNFQAVNKTIGEITVNTQIRYRVPRYQRSFAWGKEEILDFWNDLTEEREYFLGSFIFNYEYEESEGIVEIIDGQQRLLTITIFAAAMRDLAIQLGENKYAEKVQKDWIAFENLREEETVRILCGDSTNKFFSEYIQTKGKDISDAKKLTKEEKRIQECYLFLRKKLSDKLNGYSDAIDKKNCLIGFTEKLFYLKIIWIKIQNDADAYTIFESVNARGVDLSTADLLKNSIFKEVKPGPRIDFAKKTWGEIIENVQAADWELTKFIRYYWLSKYSHIPEKRLFRQIKQKITNYEDFLVDLKKASDLFRAIVVGGEEDYLHIPKGVVIHRSLVGIRNMAVSQCFVFFMSLLRNAKGIDTDISSIFEFIEKFTYNYSVICKMPGNQVEKLYSRYATSLEKEITDDSIKKKNKVKNIQRLLTRLKGKLKELRPPFEQFEQGFMELSYKPSEKTTKLLRYTLCKINNLYDTGELVPDFYQVNIEHILPQNPSCDWELKKKDIAGYVNKLGNLSLLSITFNKRAGNKNIKDKLKFLEKSRIKLTEKVVDFIKKNGYQWGKDEIDQRHKDFCKLAYREVWDFT